MLLTKSLSHVFFVVGSECQSKEKNERSQHCQESTLRRKRGRVGGQRWEEEERKEEEKGVEEEEAEVEEEEEEEGRRKGIAHTKSMLKITSEQMC